MKNGRKFAELLTFGVSVLFILGLGSYFLHQGVTHDQSQFLELKTELHYDQIKTSKDYFIIPLEISNVHGRTPVKAVFMAFLGEGELPREREISVDYLDKEGSQTVYLTLKKKPEPGSIKVEPQFYYFE